MRKEVLVNLRANYERVRYLVTKCLVKCSSGGRSSLEFELHLREYWCSPRRMTSENLRGMWIGQKLFPSCCLQTSELGQRYGALLSSQAIQK